MFENKPKIKCLNSLKEKFSSSALLNARNKKMATKKNLKKTYSLVFSIVRAIFLFCLCLVLLYPILIMLSISLRNPNELYDPTVVWIPKSIVLDAYQYIFTYANLKLGDALIRSAFISVVGTACQLGACMAAGYGLARFNFKGKKIMLGLLIFTIIVPPQVIGIPTMIYFQKFDLFGLGRFIGLFTGSTLTVPLYNTSLAYFLPALLGNGIKSGLFIFIFIQFFRNLPHELQDAAAIDGCGRFKTFWRIMLPLSGAAILTVTLFSLVWCWNDSYISRVQFDTLNTASTILEGLESSLKADLSSRNEIAVIPRMQATALISVTPLLALYVVLQKYFTESIERTGIVG